MAIFTAIGAAIFGAGTFGALATAAVLEIGTGIAASLIGKALSGQADQSQSNFGVQGRVNTGGDLSRTIMLGYGATAGSLVYANEWGVSGQASNAYFTQVFCVGDYPVDSLAQVWVSGELCTLDATPHASYGYPVIEYRKDGADYLWIKFHDGTQTTADTFLTGAVASIDRPYASTRVGVGCPYIIATALVNETLFSGYPSFKFALNGAPLYDPSKDTTVGGSGLQRWTDPSTWGGDGDNLPAVQIYNLLRGITYAGSWLYGLQNLPDARVPHAEIIAAINKCRATIAGPDGDEATYRSGGEIRVGVALADAIEALLTSCQGRLAEIGGVYKLHVGAPDDAVFSFTDGDIISTEQQSFTPFFGLADTVNGISATYPSPVEGWNNKVAPPLLRSDFEVLDGNRRLLADVSLDMVPYGAQVQRLMKSALEEARRARRHTFVLPSQAFILEPNDTISWTSARNGYSAKLFRVDGIADRANLDVLVDLTEVDPSDYDWDQETDYTAVSDGPVVRVRPTPQAVVDWAVAPYSVLDSTGTARRPAIQMTWDGAQPDVRALLFEVRLASDASLVLTGEFATRFVDGVGTTPPGTLLGNEDYEARGKYDPISDRDTTWSSWLPVTTPNISEAGVTPEDILLAAKDVLAQLGQVRQLIEQFKQIGSIIEGIDRENYVARNTLSRSISVQLGDLSASFDEIIEVALGPGGAIATALESLYAAMGGNTAQVNVQWSAQAGVDGYAARYAVQAAVDDGDFRAATLFLDVPSDTGQPTRIGLAAGQTVFLTSDGTPIAAIDEDGIFGSTNGVVQLDMIGGAFSITVP